jgi:hypothetical protein
MTRSLNFYKFCSTGLSSFVVWAMTNLRSKASLAQYPMVVIRRSIRRRRNGRSRREGRGRREERNECETNVQEEKDHTELDHTVPKNNEEVDVIQCDAPDTDMTIRNEKIVILENNSSFTEFVGNNVHQAQHSPPCVLVMEISKPSII